MAAYRSTFLAAGGNRHSSAADWQRGILAFGAGKNLAIWHVGPDAEYGVSQILPGHTDDITAVRLFRWNDELRSITGSSDKTLRIWAWDSDANAYQTVQTLTAHEGSINTVATLDGAALFVSCSADGTLSVWSYADDTVNLTETITLRPKYLPLTCALARLEDGSVALAVAGTSSTVQLYVRPADASNFELQATLTGHEGWIRSLDFATDSASGDLFLASASQDKYIRLWRFSRHGKVTSDGSDVLAMTERQSLSNKAHQVGSQGCKYKVTFEALLIGHEDWIYTVRWAPSSPTDGLRLLSSSADNSLAIWEADVTSGVWICRTRLGEISSQKGSTSATGSTGGFWIGLWQSDGHGVVSLGRTGSWRRWQYDRPSDAWLQQTSISGHVKEVQDVEWAPDGSYLLSTGSDQTTRLWAEWEQEDATSWHEFSRPQIHGYDLNCIGSITSDQYISGADEKLLRVFNKPKAIDQLMARLCGTEPTVNGELSDAANIPVLGLSNKAITAAADDEPNGTTTANGDEREAPDPASVTHKSTLDLAHPPFEDHLARHTLWPEHEKLYGHGYEISAVATSPDGSVVATACKASSIDHAVIRIYECQTWREVKPPLKAHNLTVTSLAFSPDSRWLLSVSRDRQWALFKRSSESSHVFEPFKITPKAHARMILDCCWAPSAAGTIFATAGRDKAVKIWAIITADGNTTAQHVATISTLSAVTAVAIAPTLASPTAAQADEAPSQIRLAYGTEDGGISILRLAVGTFATVSETAVPATLAPSAAVNALRWRPRRRKEERGATGGEEQLAVASDDCSVRIIDVAD